MATGTLTPSPWQTVDDTNGNPVSGALINTYLAGTLTRVATYTDVGLTVANPNPIQADGAGRYVAYLSPGSSYKFVVTDSAGVAIRTQDNIPAVPPSSANLDITGTAGEALTAGQSVYLSDGSNSKVAGSWYKTDATNPYSSTIGPVGFVPATIAAGAAGTIRMSGIITGLSALTIGTTYFLSASSPGAVTSTAPTNNIRAVGVADTTASIVLNVDPAVPPIAVMTCNGRLTLTTGVPVTTADVTAATTLRFTPYEGNRVALFDGTWWSMRTFAELSIAVPATTSQMYDVWLFDNAGTLTLELLAWTNDSTRATALTTQDGVLSKTGALTRRYLGSFRTTGSSGQTEDSIAKRYVWNYYNRVPRFGLVNPNTSWTYTVNTLRQANGDAANQLDFVIGVAEVPVHVQIQVMVSNDSTNPQVGVAIGDNSTTAAATNAVTGALNMVGGTIAGARATATASLDIYPAAGRHPYMWLEQSQALGTTTWFSAGSSGSGVISGCVDG